MSEKTKFIARLLEGERMSDLCKEFSISRKTGYKIKNRYLQEGIYGLEERPRVAFNNPNRTPENVIKRILELKDTYKTWGAPKIRSYLLNLNTDFKVPASSTIHTILEKNNLVKKKKRNKYRKSQGSILSTPTSANELWCCDFKGQFRMKNRKYCYPLTVTDQASRYIIGCEACEQISENESMTIFEDLFLEYGLPQTIRSDNGVPFSSNSYFGMSKLSLFWFSQGIKIERTKPASPQENGAHERMHRTLKEDVKIAENILEQQEILESFKKVYNEQRPHMGINSKTPSSIYIKSSRKYSKILDFDYSNTDSTGLVGSCGGVTLNKTRIYLGRIFYGYRIGSKSIGEGLSEIYFNQTKIGYFDQETAVMEPIKDAFYTERET